MTLHCTAQVVDIIRESKVDMVINFTAGMGGDHGFWVSRRSRFPLEEAGTDMVGATERLEHVRNLLPEICTIDCGTMNFGQGGYVMTNTPAVLQGDGTLKFRRLG